MDQILSKTAHLKPRNRGRVVQQVSCRFLCHEQYALGVSTSRIIREIFLLNAADISQCPPLQIATCKPYVHGEAKRGAQSELPRDLNKSFGSLGALCFFRVLFVLPIPSILQ